MDYLNRLFQTDRRTDRQTDRRHAIAILHRAVKKRKKSFLHLCSVLESSGWQTTDFMDESDRAGLTAADAWAVADNRSTWRALRPTAGYAQH